MNTSTTPKAPTCTASELFQRWKADPKLYIVDVRTPAEFSQSHFPGAANRPLGSWTPDEFVREFGHDSGWPVYLHCRTSVRATTAINQLKAAGVNHVILVTDGFEAWNAEGYETHGNPHATGMSLERQVRIAAGTLVAMGTLLAACVSPWFLLLSGFVGCGLIFAGLTDSCGMGMLIARMPWNQ